MNIISNNCIGGFLYKNNKKEYTNPFIWSAVLATDMLKLIQNYDKINFKNVSIAKSNFYKTDKSLDIFKLKIDNLIDVHYTHYLFNANYSVPKTQGTDILYNKIWEYVVAKYNSRLSKMNEKPTFLILGEYNRPNSLYNYTYDNEKKILEAPRKYKLILITRYKEFLKYNSKNTLVIFDKAISGTAKNMPQDYAKRYNKQILSFAN